MNINLPENFLNIFLDLIWRKRERKLKHFSKINEFFEEWYKNFSKYCYIANPIISEYTLDLTKCNKPEDLSYSRSGWNHLVAGYSNIYENWKKLERKIWNYRKLYLNLIQEILHSFEWLKISNSSMNKKEFLIEKELAQKVISKIAHRICWQEEINEPSIEKMNTRFGVVFEVQLEETRAIRTTEEKAEKAKKIIVDLLISEGLKEEINKIIVAHKSLCKEQNKLRERLKKEISEPFALNEIIKGRCKYCPRIL